MKMLTILAFIAAVGFLFAPGPVIAGPAGPPNGLDVTIVNSNPIPVTGEINASVQGDVNIVNTPDVTVSNDITNPVNVSEVGEASCVRELAYIHRHDILRLPANVVVLTEEIPPERIFVIETASIHVNVLIGDMVYRATITKGQIPGVPTDMVIEFPLITQDSTAASQNYAATVAARAVISEGKVIALHIGKTGGHGDPEYEVALHGYYTNANCPRP